MPRTVIGGLIQAAAPISDPGVPIAEAKEAAIRAHVPLIEEAARRGVQILGLQEVFNGPYFCPTRTADILASTARTTFRTRPDLGEVSLQARES